MNYRSGTIQDLDAICLLIKDAITEMERHGIYQWDEIYPARSDFEKDINNNNLYVVYDEDMLIAFYVISGECDEQYDNAQWRCEGSSAYILHRFCVSPKVQNKGIGKTVLLHIEDQIKDMGYRSSSFIHLSYNMLRHIPIQYRYTPDHRSILGSRPSSDLF